MFYCALHYVHSSFAIILMGCFALFVFTVSHACCVSVPCGAMGLSAVCDYGISCSYLLTVHELTKYLVG